ncbi:helix-turn-helix transcriptional regulator [Deferribacter autotrophicus]|nr:helix-turn-helix transcriptional regulator [Deferribacter autotrophicus]
MSDLESLGNFLRQIRINHKITQKDLAKILGLSPTFVNNIENGKKRPTAETVFKIFQIFNLSYSDITFILNSYLKLANSKNKAKLIESLLSHNIFLLFIDSFNFYDDFKQLFTTTSQRYSLAQSFLDTVTAITKIKAGVSKTLTNGTDDFLATITKLKENNDFLVFNKVKLTDEHYKFLSTFNTYLDPSDEFWDIDNHNILIQEFTEALKQHCGIDIENLTPQDVKTILLNRYNNKLYTIEDSLITRAIKGEFFKGKIPYDLFKRSEKLIQANGDFYVTWFHSTIPEIEIKLIFYSSLQLIENKLKPFLSMLEQHDKEFANRFTSHILDYIDLLENAYYTDNKGVGFRILKSGKKEDD